MGYGLGIALLVLGLIFALAVNADAPGLDVNTLGWILALAGVLVIVLTAVQANARRQQRTVHTTRHSDGSQTVEERRSEVDPPAPPPSV